MDESAEVETVTELTAEMGGVWLVTTQGTRHVWDLDAGTYERRPGPDSVAGALWWDGKPHRLFLVKSYPRVGQRFSVYFDHPDAPDDFTLGTHASVVARIERIG